MDNVYIIDYKRTPFGSIHGALSKRTAIELATTAIASLKPHSPPPEMLIIGQALPAGCGQSIGSKIIDSSPNHASMPSITVNKVCASGMEAVMMGADVVKTARCAAVLVVGVESMSNVPLLMSKHVDLKRFGEKKMMDGLEVDGLTDVISGHSMGVCGEMCAKSFGVSRGDQDDFAKESFENALQYDFSQEVIAMTMVDGQLISKDEQLKKYNPAKMDTLKPAFDHQQGTITAANSSPMSDGAAALLLSNDADKALAKIVGYCNVVMPDTMSFPMAPIPCIQKLLNEHQLSVSNIDYFEINEAFAFVPLIASKALNIDVNRINTAGGAVAIGHPLGASGARIVGHLAIKLANNANSKYGVATICNGGGGASAILLERV